MWVSTSFAMTICELETRAKSDVASPEGNSYEMVAVQSFWGNSPTFLRKCAPPNTPIPEPFTIFVEIMKNGDMGQLEVNPSTKVAECIAKHVRGRTFPKPPYPYVLQIDLSFKN